jgi:hypothetical protein
VIPNAVIENRFMFRDAYILTRERAAASHAQNELFFLQGLQGHVGNLDGWEAFCELLGERSDYRSIELPGFGSSVCSDHHQFSFHEFIELAVEIHKTFPSSPKRRVLIGHDFGALIAQLAALELSRMEVPIVLDLVLINPCTLEEELSRKQIKEFESTSRPVLNRIRESWPGPLEKKAWTRMMKNYSGSILVLRGSQNPFSSLFSVHEILNAYRNVEYFEHEEVGRLALLEDPEWVAEKVRNFLFRTQRQCDIT